ncbi:hypothetical protein [Diaminobutyricimonas sp. LJ205]|uniref:hypothetical protein n=1 Tax=Diaminobutyricimonas sp. LJ205 TaxID=2683590 RepID=UPI0018DEF167|nr:hypothetical protein [Diaminobutyricimonas sp. LJ205]
MGTSRSTGNGEVAELTGGEGGRWRVVTLHSEYHFDLDMATVERVPGPNAAPTVNDVKRPIRSIGACQVGERGRWTMHPDDFEIDYYWQISGEIQQIERISERAHD